MILNIDNMSLIELQALAYQTYTRIEQERQNLMILQQQITLLEKQEVLKKQNDISTPG
jgi:hypothetical protein